MSQGLSAAAPGNAEINFFWQLGQRSKTWSNG